MKEHARSLRKRQTETEKRLWYHLRDRRMKGMKFRRQHPIGPYIVDFYCPEAHLAIELDGGGHAMEGQKDRDEKRSRALAARRVRILRFWDNEVWKETDAVLRKIWDALPDDPSPASR